MERINGYKITQERIQEETAFTPNGNMRFKTHFSNNDGSIVGWYVMD